MKRDEIRIAPEPLVTLPKGRAIYSVIEGGEVRTGTAKDGSPAVAVYNEGCFVLTAPGGRLIVGPVDPDKAIELAIAVCASDPIALTGSQHIHILATALLGIAACMPAEPPQSSPPIANAEVA
jgi:hypothetical protein